MKILFLAHRVPYPPNKGDKIRSFHQLRFLAKNNSVNLMALVDEPEEMAYKEKLEEFCESVTLFPLRRLISKVLSFRALFLGKPLTLPYFYSPAFHRAVKAFILRERVDIVYAFSSPMAQYVRHGSSTPRVVDFVDADSDKWRQYAEYVSFPFSWLFQREGRLLHRYEVEIAKEFDRTLVISDKEKELVEGHNPDSRISVLPNGVDTEYFRPVRKGKGQGIVFTGALDYFPNVDGVLSFARTILPSIRQKVDDVSFTVVGSHPQKEILALHGKNGMMVHSNVPDIRPFLEGAAVVVCPLRICRGVQNKVLEAMAMGRAVVASPGAFEGIRAEPGKDLVVAELPDSFEREVISLLEQPERRHTLQENARKAIEKEYLWDKSLQQLEEILATVGERFAVDEKR